MAFSGPKAVNDRITEIKMLYIGIDLGTSAAKLLLTDAAGRILNAVTKEYPISFPQPGWAEQNPVDWWSACLIGLEELLEGQDRALVAGIAVAGQMHGLVTMDEDDQIIRTPYCGTTAAAPKRPNGSIPLWERKS